jgi:hypothetical protein
MIGLVVLVKVGLLLEIVISVVPVEYATLEVEAPLDAVFGIVDEIEMPVMYEDAELLVELVIDVLEDEILVFGSKVLVDIGLVGCVDEKVVKVLEGETEFKFVVGETVTVEVNMRLEVVLCWTNLVVIEGMTVVNLELVDVVELIKYETVVFGKEAVVSIVLVIDLVVVGFEPIEVDVLTEIVEVVSVEIFVVVTLLIIVRKADVVIELVGKFVKLEPEVGKFTGVVVINIVLEIVLEFVALVKGKIVVALLIAWLVLPTNEVVEMDLVFVLIESDVTAVDELFEVKIEAVLLIVVEI